MRYLVLRSLVAFDNFLHEHERLRLCPQTVRDRVGWAAEVTYGWGPHASDWQRVVTARPWVARFHDWYWKEKP
ncbi:MAG: hypothetical protein HY323_05570 [Betaproteobacteria bacterium]|nr:hypothetical protein [Betaproteobacteria bacterium]